jgi:hypothetical protein
MTDMIFTIFIGVFSGIITSIFIWISVQIFKKLIIPWYQQTIYRGIDVSGEWTSTQEYSGKVLAEQTIILKQKGHKITGTLISRNDIPSKGQDTTSFILNGEIFDNYVDLEYQIKDKKLLGRGSQLLKVKDGGQKLEGGLVAIDRFSTEVMVSKNVEWKRK